MDKLHRAVREIHVSDAEDLKREERGEISPLSRLLVTFFYILMVISFPKYDLGGLAGMVLYLLITGILEGISLKKILTHVWPVFLLVSVVGIANPFIEREVYGQIGSLSVTYGMISMVTLMLKGIFSITASCYLIMTVGMEGICGSLRQLHLPAELVTILFLIYRYLIVLLKEAERMMQAYKLRAPGQKGIHYKSWGPFLGHLFLRSLDRGQVVYESMLLRGYTGEIQGRKVPVNKGYSMMYVLIWVLILSALRVLPVFQMAGQMVGF